MKNVVEMHPSGLLVDLVDPRPEHISIEDIAWSLSRTARFNGSTGGEFVYSVAQHSVWVAMAVRWFYPEGHKRGCEASFALQALLHDAHEAYTGDIVTPMKQMESLHAGIAEIEERLQRTIHDALDVPWPDEGEGRLIKQADDLASIVEAHHLVPSRGTHWAIPPSEVPGIILDTFNPPLPPMHAYEQFMETYCDLVAGRPLEALCA